MKTILLIFAILFSNLTYAQEHNHNHNHEQHSEQQEDAYVCPMHPEITMDHKGNCPICGMFLVKKDEVESADIDQDHLHEHQTNDSEEKTYVCPMHPQIKNSKKSKCPICGMDLVEEKMEGAKQASSIFISPERQQNFNLKTHSVKADTFWQYFKTYGTSIKNESDITNQTIYFDGWIKDITDKTNGDFISEGDYLFSVFSPEIINAQNDYLQAINHNNSLNPEQLLINYGIQQQVIETITKNKKVLQNIPFYATKSGYIDNLNLKNGDRINKNQSALRIIPNNSWVDVIIPEKYKKWDIISSFASFSYQNNDFGSTITNILPESNKGNLIARIKIDQFIPFNETFPVEVFGKPINDTIIIPTEAILFGENSARVIIYKNNHFKPQEIEIGLQNNTHSQILKGLNEGDEIILSGQFLVDSQAQIKGLQ